MISAASSLRRRLGALLVDSAFRGAASAGRLHPLARPERHKVEVLRDIPYRREGGSPHKLDIYRPTDRKGPLPIVLYVHGGGFRILSKDTHWIMALAFARRGYLVFTIDYRLAPENPYPAALEDASAALVWTAENAERYGGDPDRIFLAGESAGANLITSLAIASSYARPEPWARAVFESDVRPRAVLPACGILQVSDPARFLRRKAALGTFINDRISEVSSAYLSGAAGDAPGALELADPLVVLERGLPPDRPLPPFFVPVGTKDPVLDDSRRLKSALDRLGTPCEIRIYEGEVHAFHALVWRKNAQQCWKDTFTFLDQHAS
jgi:acetyl esterase